MTDIDVMQKALEKARENGWTALKSQTIRCYKDDAALIVGFFMGPAVPPVMVNFKVIFSHDFAENFYTCEARHSSAAFCFQKLRNSIHRFTLLRNTVHLR